MKLAEMCAALAILFVLISLAGCSVAGLNVPPDACEPKMLQGLGPVMCDETEDGHRCGVVTDDTLILCLSWDCAEWLCSYTDVHDEETTL